MIEVILFTLLPYLISASSLRGRTAACPDGGILDRAGNFCCTKSCEKCGGHDCQARPGGELNCCTEKIFNSCDLKSLPCAIQGKDDGVAQCPPNSIADESGRYCCPDICSECGEIACSSPHPCDRICCANESTELCLSNMLPCKLAASSSSYQLGDPTHPVTVQSPTQPTTQVTTDPPTLIADELCPNGGKFAEITNHVFSCYLQVCCPASCAICDFSDECIEPEECCAKQIVSGSFFESSDVDISCRDHNPPCVLPPNPDPCSENPCQNGARCGLHWEGKFGEEYNCLQDWVCECNESDGNYSGDYCEIDCKDGTPCGHFSYLYYSYHYSADNTCCNIDEQCEFLNTATYCVPINGPTTCHPNPCLNGGICDERSDGEMLLYSYCICTAGYDGPLCENEVH